jgi:hypothetical protein
MHEARKKKRYFRVGFEYHKWGRESSLVIGVAFKGYNTAPK